ncbi:uncharacterized protein LOC125259710 isoform X2 [Megalobrama amblycephala]|uniref:uncharacterized protein LOC125259710 isoform X2 n=1 Tax=Megalobrama amblycephala TaxID=75352 RepID=UPI0020142F43|nr:uncharacterized protein LOC125259710 isoform X2 [Megalobrama amblycephala]XP_048033545.1 uncharacterized protein LOC125259710 isoform X2 [Megalobrama amblycephala]XP_048033546.1 uncharacterized protein LOC125259710 isoform X2 [Megalobrama amblycephala]
MLILQSIEQNSLFDWCTGMLYFLCCLMLFLGVKEQLGLKVYVAALAAHQSEFSDTSLGSDRLIVAFLKGANRLCLQQGVQSQTWDLGMVLDSLCHPPFEPMLASDIKWLSFKTAFLLAITTAKRVSELHALSVSGPCLHWSSGSSVSLWPNLLAALPADQADLRDAHRGAALSKQRLAHWVMQMECDSLASGMRLQCFLPARTFLMTA